MTLRQKECLSIGLALAGAGFGMLSAKYRWGTAAICAALAVLAAGLVLRLVWHRCPHCGAYLGRRWVRFCPSCREHIDYDVKNS